MAAGPECLRVVAWPQVLRVVKWSEDDRVVEGPKGLMVTTWLESRIPKLKVLKNL